MTPGFIAVTSPDPTGSVLSTEPTPDLITTAGVLTEVTAP